jgi:pantoate--beta-alanine ligase
VSAPVEIIEDPRAMRARALAWKRDGRRVAFVPTMGYLHEGHLSLLREARRRGDVVVLSIFVNPTQFGPKEDLSRYPRDLEGDLAKAASAGCDLAFIPSAEAMYPPGFQTWVEPGPLATGLCGDRRPGHFRGVVTVVAKLFSLVLPDVALFGEKDYQQLRVIARMTRDLDLGVEVVGCPLVREPDGLAMSSRNAYLSPADRARALALSRALFAARDAFAAGERDAAALVARARAVVDAEPAVRLDYLELRDAEELTPVAGAIARPALLAIAAFVGPADRPTRLIDNVVLR